ncbi:hypothetical protein ACFQZI_06430 [Mucilaginibacter lutimaris]|uniref:Uncharacterized protein n=1 Tax=Mucilaginibacter lutimaris TaxID=931629 RepID=A0ABW2ZE67_9SPHI
MDRFTIKCLIGDQEMELQLDKKAMPGENGPCFMITSEGSFKGYISRKKNGGYQQIGDTYYTAKDLQAIGEHLRQYVK